MIYKIRKSNGDHISYMEVDGTDMSSAKNYAESRACDIEEMSGGQVEYFTVIPAEDFDRKMKSEETKKLLEHYLEDKSKLTFRKPYKPHVLPRPGEP